ncbi:MAG: hypothetical protein QXI19_14445 [Candidatus Caldarchaeum sp.]
MKASGSPWARAWKRFRRSFTALFFVLLSGLFFFAGVPAGIISVLTTFGVVYGFFVVYEMNTQPPTPWEELWSDLDAPTRGRLRPLYKLSMEIQSLLHSHSTHPVLAVLGEEMMEQVHSVMKQGIEVGCALRRVNKLLQVSGGSSSALTELQAKMEGVDDPVARASLESAIAARQQEMLNYEQLEFIARRLDAYLEQAEGILGELRSRVALVAAKELSPKMVEEETTLPGLAERLKRLSATMKESVEALTPINGIAG